ncbi:tRNA pseudouridine(13) synthase TruD [Candidatus Woesearchaeota archaeon]|nr:MAG: tRNA pseudouridine(13) synthase TruD [Candidatus Woesearchaeota archaeon]
MVLIKHFPEDFVVDEVSSVVPFKEGAFSYFILRKKNRSTFEALDMLSQAWRINRNSLGYAGLKDKRAITSQVCSIKGAFREFSNSFVSVEFFGKGSRPVSLGDLEGNRFRITVRGVRELPDIRPRFLNLFGSQRFSSHNVEIGRALIKRDFRRAASILLEKNPHLIRRDLFDKGQFISALRSIPRKRLLLFAHSYQSFIWNRAAESTCRDELAIVGFGTSESDIDDCTRSVLEEEGVSPRDFIVREFPEISLEGSSRSVWAVAEDLKVGPLEFDEVSGLNKVVLSFFLKKGCYATEFIRQSFGSL